MSNTWGNNLNKEYVYAFKHIYIKVWFPGMFYVMDDNKSYIRKPKRKDLLYLMISYTWQESLRTL